MVASATRGGRETPILVSCAEVCDEICQGFVRFSFCTPVTAWHFEETGGVDKVVAEADDGGL